MTAVKINIIAQQAYQDCLSVCEDFEADYLTELLVQDPAQRWWRDTFRDHSGELAQRIKEHLLAAQRAESGCLILGRTSKLDEAQRVYWRGRRQKVYQLVAWGLCGKIPGKKSVVRHLCNNRLCIHPEHLKVGTQAQNLNDQRINRLKNWPHQ
ncbi:HNH endonuclease [Falsihalocynthiibacter sp. BN13B15]|uniref:HNH endonuclease n=1 Tax=Falsihalocynthiibacter sp. BN13B15 TaxID=3240871 RepID=UPI00350F9686